MGTPNRRTPSVKERGPPAGGLMASTNGHADVGLTDAQRAQLIRNWFHSGVLRLQDLPSSQLHCLALGQDEGITQLALRVIRRLDGGSKRKLAWTMRTPAPYPQAAKPRQFLHKNCPRWTEYRLAQMWAKDFLLTWMCEKLQHPHCTVLIVGWMDGQTLRSAP